MYAAMNSNGEPIAFHKKLSVLSEYVDNVRSYHDGEVKLRIAKIKNKKVKGLKDFDDLYLVRIGDTFIQNKFYNYMRFVSDEPLYDLQRTISTLEDILTIKNDELSSKDIKHIKKSIKIVKAVLEKDKKYTPTYQEMEELKTNYDSFTDEFGE